jgi:hypothetical protein
VLASIGVFIGVFLCTIAAFASSGATGISRLKDNPDLYVFYLGHLFDLTPESLMALRVPLLIAGLGLGITALLHCITKMPELKAAILAVGMVIFFGAADVAFLIFAPRLTSKPIANEINRHLGERSIIVIDGEYEEGSSVAFYTGSTVLLHNGRSSNLEYGSNYRDAPALFINDKELKRLWDMTDSHIFLVTYKAKQEQLETIIPQSKFVVARYGDKILLSNFLDESSFEVARYNILGLRTESRMPGNCLSRSD